MENNIEEIVCNLLEIGGCFAVAANFSDYIFLVCDCICSIPLFYSIKQEKIYVGTNAVLIGDVANIPMNEDNIQEFLCTGYVTQERTLFKDIYQVMPGQIVRIYKTSGQIDCKNYFNMDYDFSSRLTETQLIAEYDKVLLNVFGRLIKRLNGRTVLIPLSGGCDSRTVAVMLKRLGYKNVICFSYGRKGSSETELSKKVAKALNYVWYYVEYNAETWKKFYNSEDYTAFLKFSGKGARIGCIQALPAVLELKSKGVLPLNSVVVPGHTQDFICGSHIEQYNTKEDYNIDSFAVNITKNHYNLTKAGKCLVKKSRWLYNIPQKMDLNEYNRQYQKWEWVNRQAKFIANDVRAYEYAGYSWEMPFWDKTNCEFWMHIPVSLLYGRKLQYLHMQKKIDPVAGLDISYIKNDEIISVKRYVKKFIKKMLPFIVNIKKYFMRLDDYYTNVNAFYSFMKKNEFNKNLKKYGLDFSVNTLIARDTINLLKKDVSKNGRL